MKFLLSPSPPPSLFPVCVVSGLGEGRGKVVTCLFLREYIFASKDIGFGDFLLDLGTEVFQFFGPVAVILL